uniref:Protein kinase domain-containing protein n=1 Tax=Panagrolaimus superbus TaxID=310955 RepID=A0A914XW99_9BILA
MNYIIENIVYNNVYKKNIQDKGNFGKIIPVCKESKKNEKFALKMSKEGELGQIRNEIKILKLFKGKIGSENIINLWGCDETKGYLLLDLAEKDLGDYLKEKEIGEKKVQVIMIQIINGLKFIHHLDVVHGDLKATNILYFGKSKFKICDFGRSFLLKEKKECERDLQNIGYLLKNDFYKSKMDKSPAEFSELFKKLVPNPTVTAEEVYDLLVNMKF